VRLRGVDFVFCVPQDPSRLRCYQLQYTCAEVLNIKARSGLVSAVCGTVCVCVNPGAVYVCVCVCFCVNQEPSRLRCFCQLDRCEEVPVQLCLVLQIKGHNTQLYMCQVVNALSGL